MTTSPSTSKIVVYTFLFVFAYILVYFALGAFIHADQECFKLIVVEFVLWGAFVAYTVYIYNNSDAKDVDYIIDKIYEFINLKTTDSSSAVFIISLLVAFYVLLLFTGLLFSDQRPFTVNVVENVLWFLALVLGVSLGIKYIAKTMKKGGRKDKKEDEPDALSYWIGQILGGGSDASDLILKKGEGDYPTLNKTGVYHITGKFTKSEAAEECKRSGGELATYKQLKAGYKYDGKEWCDPGWSEDNIVAFLTQSVNWDNRLCGKVGIHAEIINDTSKKYGANCYIQSEGFCSSCVTEDDDELEYTLNNFTDMKESFQATNHKWMKI